MSIRSKGITSLLLVVITLLFFSGCGKGRAVPTEEETKNAIESHIKTLGNISPEIAVSMVKVAGIDSFRVLEMYDHGYDFSKLSEKIHGKVDVNYLNQTKGLYKGDWAIVKVSYALRFDKKSGSGNLPPQEDGVRSQWFLMQKPEQGKWNVGMPLTESIQD